MGLTTEKAGAWDPWASRAPWAPWGPVGPGPLGPIRPMVSTVPWVPGHTYISKDPAEEAFESTAWYLTSVSKAQPNKVWMLMKYYSYVY